VPELGQHVGRRGERAVRDDERLAVLGAGDQEVGAAEARLDDARLGGDRQLGAEALVPVAHALLVLRIGEHHGTAHG
jgi:hypothetical protein